MTGVVVPPAHVVVMGVAGCGKSAVGRRLAALAALPMIEGDDFHPPGNIRKMRDGVALTDDDRAGWLAVLALQLSRRPAGAVLACSALKQTYRDTLRAAVPDLKFVFLSIGPEESLRRVAQRPGHFYPPSLVNSQFEALQHPGAEPAVLVLDGALPLDELAERGVGWLAGTPLA